MNRLLARPVAKMVQVPARTHIINSDTTHTWHKITLFLCPVMVVSGYIAMQIRHPAVLMRPPHNAAPWTNMTEAKMPWSDDGKQTPFFDDNFNRYVNQGYKDGNNEGGPVPNQHH